MHRVAALRAAGLLTSATILLLGCHSGMSNGRTTPMNTLSSQEVQAGWKLLFDGRTTDGWRNYRKETLGPGWTVIDGMLTRSGEKAGDIITRDKYRNFELALDWSVADGGNSGVMYGATEEGDYIWQSAPEMQLLDDEGHADGKSPLTSAGSAFALYPAPRGAVHPAGTWNSSRLIVNGNHVEHWLNGQKLLSYELGSDEWKERVAASKFKSMPLYGKAGEGHIGLQDHGDRIQFRNIRIRTLP